MTGHEVLAAGYQASWSIDCRNPNDRLLGSLQIHDTEFTWQSFGYQGGVGYHTDATGKREKIVVMGDEWKPYEEPANAVKTR